MSFVEYLISPYRQTPLNLPELLNFRLLSYILSLIIVSLPKDRDMQTSFH